MELPIAYEIHVTVQTNDVTKFIRECEHLGIKPIVLDLQKSDGSKGIQDVMTSSKLIGSEDGEKAFYSMREISKSFTDKGFTVVREKIETVPWHPKALIHGKSATENEGYFETHLATVVSPEEISRLSLVCKTWGLHLSRNPYKELKNGRNIQMLTYRKRGINYTSFDFIIRSIIAVLYTQGFILHKEPETEFALYDSKVNHDAVWMTS